MTLVKTYIIPHGDEILSNPNKESRRMKNEIARETEKDNSETILIVSPHSLRIPVGVPVINTSYLSGKYKIGKKLLKRNYESDKLLNSELIRSSPDFIETGFVSGEGKLSSFPVDFGALIPLTFFGKRKLSLLGQWRTFDKDRLVNLGERMYDVVSSSKRSTSVVFSADQAHAHLKSGPYGFDPRAKQYDELVVDALFTDSFENVLDLDPAFIEGAKPDSFWNLIMFFGFIRRGQLVPKFHYYYLQRYFGMLLATAS